jgi:DNA-binding NarL/FixJ family response regulator
MSEEEPFGSLRIMMIGTAQPDQVLWRQAMALASVMIDLTIHDPLAAADALAKTPVDICIIDASLSDANKADVIAAARAAQPTTLIFVSAPKNIKRPDGIDGMLGKPARVEEARKLVEICIRAKFPTRVLVVDDSGTMRSIVRKILSASNFTLDIHDAADGMAALKQLRSSNFGVVFVDYNMPGLNGFDMLSQIKRERPGAAVVMISSTLDPSIADKARAAGALAFLKKPFYPADIDAVLERYYGLHLPL